MRVRGRYGDDRRVRRGCGAREDRCDRHGGRRANGRTGERANGRTGKQVGERVDCHHGIGKQNMRDKQAGQMAVSKHKLIT